MTATPDDDGRLHWPEDTVRPEPGSSRADVKRWGIRMLAFLGLALVAVIVSSSQGRYNAATGLALLIGLIGAAVASVAGLKALYAVPPDRRTRGRSRF